MQNSWIIADEAGYLSHLDILLEEDPDQVGQSPCECRNSAEWVE
jgi:hypothetical protein